MKKEEPLANKVEYQRGVKRTRDWFIGDESEKIPPARPVLEIS